MWPNPQFPADLVTFTEKILNGKLHFCAVYYHIIIRYPLPEPINTKSFYISCILHFGIVLIEFKQIN